MVCLVRQHDCSATDMVEQVVGCLAVMACPEVSRSRIGRPRPSTTARILVVSRLGSDRAVNLQRYIIAQLRRYGGRPRNHVNGNFGGGPTYGRGVTDDIKVTQLRPKYRR